MSSSSLTLCAITNTAAVQAGKIPTATCDYNTMPLSYDDPINADFIPQLTAISAGYPQTVNGIADPENAYWCYSGDLDSYMPSIEPDSEGGAVLNLSVSNDTSVDPSLVYTGLVADRQPTDSGPLHSGWACDAAERRGDRR